MAAARQRGQRVDDDEFEVPLADALAALLPNGQVTPGAAWYFVVDGATLRIVRSVRSTPNP